MNLAQMQADCYRRMRYQSSPETDIVTRITAYLNETQREILGMKGCDLLRRETITFDCVANTPFCALPQPVNEIVTIQDRANQRILDEVSLQDIRAQDPGLTTTGTFPYEYAVIDYSAAVAQDPSTAASLWVKSDSASDGASKTVYIEGLVTGGYYQTASVALNGTTAAQLGTLATWIAVTKFYIALTAGGQTTSVGNIKLLQASGSGTELSRIPPNDDYARYTRIHLWPTPTQVNTYYADVELHVEDMATAGDEPYLPEEFHWLLVSGSLVKEYDFKQMTAQHDRQLARYTNGIANMILKLANRGGVADQSRRRAYSQLGGYFPAGS